VRQKNRWACEIGGSYRVREGSPVDLTCSIHWKGFVEKLFLNFRAWSKRRTECLMTKVMIIKVLNWNGVKAKVHSENEADEMRREVDSEDRMTHITIHRVSKIRPHFTIASASCKSAPIFFFFTVKSRNDQRKKLKLKLPPHLKSVAALPCNSKCSTAQLYSAVNSVQSDPKTFNYSNCSRGMLFLCLSTHINLPTCLNTAFDQWCNQDFFKFKIRPRP